MIVWAAALCACVTTTALSGPRHRSAHLPRHKLALRASADGADGAKGVVRIQYCVQCSAEIDC